jgi:hypothetical protein
MMGPGTICVACSGGMCAWPLASGGSPALGFSRVNPCLGVSATPLVQSPIRHCQTPEGVKGFLLLPKRWIVERTFAWFGRYHRLGKNYEYLTDTCEAMIRMAMIHLMACRLACMTCFSTRS